MAESSVRRRQVSLPGSRLSQIESSLSSLSSPTFPLSLDPISSSSSQTDTSTTTPSSSPTSTATSMSVTLPGSILSTIGPTASTTSGSTLPSILPSFSWINLPSTINTCSSATLSWQYAGPQETLQFLLISNASPHTLATGFRKRAGNSTTLATNIDAAAASWTWSKVNFTAGQYVVEAYGTGVDTVSSTFSIVNGADTSCLASSSSSSVASSGTSSATGSSSSSTSSATALPASSSNKSKSGAIAGGVVAGIAVVLAVIAAYVYFGLCRRRRPHPRRPGHGHGVMEASASLGQWGGLSSRDSCMDVMGASIDSKGASPSKVRHATSESSAAILPSFSSTVNGHHSSVTTLTATEEEKGIAYGKGYEYMESVPPLGYKANRRRSSASTSGLGQLNSMESISSPPPSAGPQGRLRSKSASQSHRALALAKLDGGDRPYPPSPPRRSIDASPMMMPVSSSYDMGFVPPPVNRTSSGGGPGARRATRKPVPALDSADLAVSPSSSPTSTSPLAGVPQPLSRGQSFASTVTMTSMLQPPQPPASRSRDSPSPSPKPSPSTSTSTSPSPARRLRPPSQGAPTRSRSREDLEAAGVELPTLDHKSSFGHRPVHYLIPDLPPAQSQ